MSDPFAAIDYTTQSASKTPALVWTSRGPDTLEASGLRHLVTQTIRSAPGWVANWTPAAEVSLVATDARILVTLRGVRLQPRAGGEPSAEAKGFARLLLVAVERHIRAQTSLPVEAPAPAPVAAPAVPRAIVQIGVRQTGRIGPGAAQIERAIRASAPATPESWLVMWQTDRLGTVFAPGNGLGFHFGPQGVMPFARADDFVRPPPVPLWVVIVANAVQAALVGSAQVAA